jgi:hypothetical protein
VGFWRDLWGPSDECRCERLDRDDVLSDIQADAAATRLAVNNAISKINQLSKDVQTMGAREDQAYAALNANIAAVKEGWAVLVAGNAAKDARIAELEAALANADANAAANLATALDADSEADAAKVEAADAAIAELVAAPAPEPQPEPTPQPPADDVA